MDPRDRLSTEGKRMEEGRAVCTDPIRHHAKCLSVLWTRWLRRQGRPLDRTERAQLETHLDGLLRKYREEWGIDVLEIRLAPSGKSDAASP
jgi:hypothetical protein